MTIKVKCKECFGEMEVIMLCSIPPIERFTCKKCGRIVEERNDKEIEVLK